MSYRCNLVADDGCIVANFPIGDTAVTEEDAQIWLKENDCCGATLVCERLSPCGDNVLTTSERCVTHPQALCCADGRALTCPDGTCIICV